MEPDPLLATYRALWKQVKDEGIDVGFEPCEMDRVGGFKPPGVDNTVPEIRISGHGWFDNVNGLPTRERPGKRLTDDELRGEVMTLAHEYGHFLSMKMSKEAGGENLERWNQYRKVIDRWDKIRERVESEDVESEDVEYYDRMRDVLRQELTDDERKLILAEETTASKYGRPALEHHGFEGLALYDEHASKNLHCYRVRLGMD